MKLKSFGMILLGTFISALAFNVFFSPYHIVSGGLSGLAVIYNYLFNYNEAFIILFGTVIIFLIGLLFLNKEDILKSFLGSILFPLFVYITGILLSSINLHIDNKLLASIMGGVTYGFGLGIIYKEGYTTGGVDIFAKMICRYLHTSFLTATIFIDTFFCIIGAFVFGFETLIYSAISIYVYSVMIDKVILGLSGNKSFYIITEKSTEVKEYIINELKHGVTVLNGRGAFSNKRKAVLFVVIPTRDYYKLKDGLKMIDENAFFVVSASYEVGGGK